MVNKHEHSLVRDTCVCCTCVCIPLPIDAWPTPTFSLKLNSSVLPRKTSELPSPENNVFLNSITYISFYILS